MENIPEIVPLILFHAVLAEIAVKYMDQKPTLVTSSLTPLF